MNAYEYVQDPSKTIPSDLRSFQLFLLVDSCGNSVYSGMDCTLPISLRSQEGLTQLYGVCFYNMASLVWMYPW
jgi:hypothetical protein